MRFMVGPESLLGILRSICFLSCGTRLETVLEMVKSCCAIGCTNRFRQQSDGGVRFYRFPADPERTKRWCHAIKRMDPDNRLVSWTASTHSYICAAHFVGGKWTVIGIVLTDPGGSKTVFGRVEFAVRTAIFLVPTYTVFVLL